MYLDHFGLNEPPFSITPDPRFVYLSDRHRDGLAHLLYGVGQGGGGGFVQLTGEVGTGKTTLCRLLLEQLPEDTHVALVLNPRLSSFELLQTICEELVIEVQDVPQGSTKMLVDRLNHYLLDAYAAGQRVVLIIDEAQNLSTEALEQVRLLTNLETATQKLLQIILIGQPELRDMLERKDLRQLAQRITARHHLTPLDDAEVEAYLRHRLAVAGMIRFPFTRHAARKVAQLTGGIPRLVNVLADRTLMAGYVHNADVIDEQMVREAAAEVLPKQSLGRWPMARWIAAAALLGIVVIGGWLFSHPEVWRDSEGKSDVALSTDARPDGRVLPEGMIREDVSTRLTDTHASRQDFSPPLSRSQWLAQLVQAGQSDGDMASLQTLLGMFGWPVDDASMAHWRSCPAITADDHGHCLRSRGTLDSLASVGQPVLVTLRTRGGNKQAVLAGIDVDEVRLMMGGTTFDVSRIDFNDAWTGEFQAYWRLPAPMTREELTLGEGASGRLVDWIADQLTVWQSVRVNQDVPPRDGPALYDKVLVKHVSAYQRQHGLVPDGLVGPETWFALSARAAHASDESPRLQSRLKR